MFDRRKFGLRDRRNDPDVRVGLQAQNRRSRFYVVALADIEPADRPRGLGVHRHTLDDLTGPGQALDRGRLHAHRAKPLANCGDAVLIADLQRGKIVLLGGDQFRAVDPVEQFASSDRIAFGAHRQVLDPPLEPRRGHGFQPLVGVDVAEGPHQTRERGMFGWRGPDPHGLNHFRGNGNDAGAFGSGRLPLHGYKIHSADRARAVGIGRNVMRMHRAGEAQRPVGGGDLRGRDGRIRLGRASTLSGT